MLLVISSIFVGFAEISVMLLVLASVAAILSTLGITQYNIYIRVVFFVLILYQPVILPAVKDFDNIYAIVKQFYKKLPVIVPFLK